jgi:hypothetical protein
MKSKKLHFLLFIGLFLPNLQAQTNPNFYLHANGVTCMCPNAKVGKKVL